MRVACHAWNRSCRIAAISLTGYLLRSGPWMLVPAHHMVPISCALNVHVDEEMLLPATLKKSTRN